MTRRLTPNSLMVLLLLFVSLSVSRVFASEANEAFVKQSLVSFFTEALQQLPINYGEDVSLDFAELDVDNLNVSGAALFSALKSRGSRIVTDADSTPKIGLQFKLSEVEFGYENQNGSIFSRGDLIRVLKVAASFYLSRDKSPVWEDYLVREYREKIELSDRQKLESSSSPLFNAELPPGPVQKLWEPVIVTSVIGGLVYLFFASR